MRNNYDIIAEFDTENQIGYLRVKEKIIDKDSAGYISREMKRVISDRVKTNWLMDISPPHEKVNAFRETSTSRISKESKDW